jgi:RNA-directed DNA polymerase
MTTVACAPMDRGETLPWKHLQRHVFTRQTRISRASCRDDVRTVRRRQRLWVPSRAARLFAVRRVAQEHQGKRSAGVAGVNALTPPQRLALAHTLRIGQKAQPVRRVWIPTPHATERRPFGMPVMANRAGQALITAALEPAWEARFEANSDGFRPGRRGQDAIEAIFASMAGQAQDGLDADSAR